MNKYFPLRIFTVPGFTAFFKWLGRTLIAYLMVVLLSNSTQIPQYKKNEQRKFIGRWHL